MSFTDVRNGCPNISVFSMSTKPGSSLANGVEEWDDANSFLAKLSSSFQHCLLVPAHLLLDAAELVTGDAPAAARSPCRS